MCGRYTLTSPEDIAARFGLGALSETGGDIRPRFNVSPSQAVPVIRTHDGKTGLRLMQWGFQPAWMAGKSKRPPPINARGETLLERPMFKSAVAKGRCLIPADGFYEWKVIPGQKAKQPMHIRLKGGELFAFAGLWTWGGDELGPTCAIITTAPNELVSTIHDRMPVILTEHGERLWLDRDAPPEEAMSVLTAYPADLMEAFAVSTAVNRAGYDDPSMLEPISEG
jgi:putative SOS response-associated peptidase YedK